MDQKAGTQTTEFRAEDWIEIYQLMALYNDYLGTGNAEGYGSLYTEDGSFAPEGKEAIVGRENLVRYIAERWKKPEMRIRTHWSGNVVIRPTAEGAESVSYTMTVDNTPGGYRVGMHMKQDKLRRENGKWLFQSRKSIRMIAGQG